MNNIHRIQEALIRQGLDAILLTDEKNQRYATGFPFTDGAVLVGREKAWLLTDSRYIEAAEKTAGGVLERRPQAANRLENVEAFHPVHGSLSNNASH